LTVIQLYLFTPMATSEIYTLSLHDALPILKGTHKNNDENDECDQCKKYKKGPLKMVEFNLSSDNARVINMQSESSDNARAINMRSEEHTSELQSLRHLVCRLLLETKNCCFG